MLSEQLRAALSSECAAQASHYDHLLRCLEHPARRAERIVSLRRRYAVRAPFRRWRSLIAEILIAVQSARRARDLDAARRCFARWLELHQRWVFVRGVLRGVADGARRGRIFARWADGAAEARRCRDGAALIASALGKLYCPAVCFAAWRRFNHTARRNRRIVARGAVQVARRIAREHFASWRGWHARFAALRLRASSSRMHAVRTRCLYRLQIHAAQEQVRAAAAIAHAARLRAARQTLRLTFDALRRPIAARAAAEALALARGQRERAAALRAWVRFAAAARRFRAFHVLSHTRHCFERWVAALPEYRLERQKFEEVLEMWERAKDRAVLNQWRAGVRAVLIEKRIRALHFVRLFAKRWKRAVFLRWTSTLMRWSVFRKRTGARRAVRTKVFVLLTWREEAARLRVQRIAREKTERAKTLRTTFFRWLAYGEHARALRIREGEQARQLLGYRRRFTLRRWAVHVQRNRKLQHQFDLMRAAARAWSQVAVLEFFIARWRENVEHQQKGRVVLRWGLTKWTAHASRAASRAVRHDEWALAADALLSRTITRRTMTKWQAWHREAIALYNADAIFEHNLVIRMLAKWRVRHGEAVAIHDARAVFDRTIVTRTFAAWCEDYYSTVATKHATAKLRILRDEAFAAWHVWAAQTRLFNAQCAETIARAQRLRICHIAFETWHRDKVTAGKSRLLVKLMLFGVSTTSHSFATWKDYAKKRRKTRQSLARVEAINAQAKRAALQLIAFRFLDHARVAMAERLAASRALATKIRKRHGHQLVVRSLSDWSRWTLLACRHERAATLRRCVHVLKQWTAACRFESNAIARQAKRYLIGWKHYVRAVRIACQKESEIFERYMVHCVKSWHKVALASQMDRIATLRRSIYQWRTVRCDAFAKRSAMRCAFVGWHGVLTTRRIHDAANVRLREIWFRWTELAKEQLFNRWRNYIQRRRNCWTAWRLFILNAQCLELAQEFSEVTTDSCGSAQLRLHFAEWRECIKKAVPRYIAHGHASRGAHPTFVVEAASTVVTRVVAPMRKRRASMSFRPRRTVAAAASTAPPAAADDAAASIRWLGRRRRGSVAAAGPEANAELLPRSTTAKGPNKRRSVGGSVAAVAVAARAAARAGRKQRRRASMAF